MTKKKKIKGKHANANDDTMVEPELQRPVPREMVWITREFSHETIDDELADLLINGTAVRARIKDATWESDSEGPDISAIFTYTHQEKPYTGKFGASYDIRHLAMGFPEYSAWLHDNMVKDGRITVLFPADNPEKHRIYGCLQLYIRQSLADSIEAYIKETNEARKNDWLEKAFGLLRGPIGLMQRDFQVYYDLITQFADVPNNDRKSMFEYAKDARQALISGRFNQTVIPELSAFIKKYKPGIWAAR